MTIEQATYADLHPRVVQAAEAGDFTILDLLDSLPWFGSGADWTPWRAFLAAAFGLPMTDREFDIYLECTGREDRPTTQADEVWLVAGRRARKSAIAALIGVWFGAFRDYTRYLAPGERAGIPIIGKNKREAFQIKTYIEAILSAPALKHLLIGDSKSEMISLATGVDIIITAASLTAGRSKTSPAGLLDEVAFYRSDESVMPDKEIIAGIRPSMATIPGSMLLGLSSPYSRRGVLYEAYERYFGRPGRILVWKAPTLKMHDNPQVRAVVTKAYEDDPVSAAAEYGAEFRKDVEVFLTIEAIHEVTGDATERKPIIPRRGEEPVRYHGFVDVSGGSSDPMALSIAHYDFERKVAIQDYLRKWDPPFDPEEVTAECAADLKRYGLKGVQGDKYGGEWPSSAFKRYGIAYSASDRVKSDIYRTFLPLVHSKSVEILDDRSLRAQLIGLDRRVSRSGHESIDHIPGSHDDMANVTAGALLRAHQHGRPQVDREAWKEARRGPQPETVLELHTQRLHGKIRQQIRQLEREQRQRNRFGREKGEFPGA